MIDAFRDQPRHALARFFPAESEFDDACKPPVAIRVLTWMFLPPEGSRARKKLTRTFTQVVLRFWKVP
jgi:hypothetical protein